MLRLSRTSSPALLFLTVVMAAAGTTSAFQLPSRSTSTIHPTRTTNALPMIKKAKKKSAPKKSGGGGFGASSSTSVSSDSDVSYNLNAPSWAKRFPFAGEVRPGGQTPQKVVIQDAVVPPDYAMDGTPKNARPLLPWVIEVKTPEQIEKMRASGKLARQVLDKAGRSLKPGMTTDEIDQIVHDETIQNGAYPSPLNYHGFPKSCCTSVNEVICHGIPDDRPLKEGDIINIDITVYLNGYHGDCSEMFVVGNNPDERTKNLLQSTYDCWIQACNFVQPGKDYKDIGAIIEEYIEPKGYNSVKNFCGHGIGSVFHTNPNILHYRNNEPNGQMAAGHTFTIEPMICEGSAKPLSWPDNWTATTSDGSRSAQFEHTLLITNDGVEALTGKNEHSPLQFWEKESTFHKGIWLGTSAAAKKRQEEINAKLLSS